jgi:surface polysaccharide O-acyltransferase-like enzyme
MQLDRGGIMQSDQRKPEARLHYIDWLRLLATLGVFLYHAARPFDVQDWMIKNADRSELITAVFVIFLGSWGMPLFFLMAGTSSKFSLRRRSGRQFARERVLRLAIPFIVGSILLTPFQVYIEWIHHGWFEGDFLDFIPTFVDSLPGTFGWISPTVFETLGIHLWFLGFLFSFSLISLPLFLWLENDNGRFISKLASIVEKRGGIFIFILPIMAVRLGLQPFFPEYANWSDFVYFLVFFIYGYILYADETFGRVIQRDWRWALRLGILSTVAIFGAVAAGVGLEWYSNPSNPGFYLAWSLISVNAWCWVITALYVGMRFMNSRNAWLNYGQEAILPFYVFHQPVIFVIVFYVVEWEAGILPKLLVVVLSSFVITLGLHEFIIRRIKPLRTLFGMKPRKVA